MISMAMRTDGIFFSSLSFVFFLFVVLSLYFSFFFVCWQFVFDIPEGLMAISD